MFEEHDIGVTWFHCTHEGCEKKFKMKLTQIKHTKNGHRPKTYPCNETECELLPEFKTKLELKTHKFRVHRKGFIWHYCDHFECRAREKSKSRLKKHLAKVHKIDVIYHACLEMTCGFATTTKKLLKQHTINIHDEGDNKCGICMEYKNSSVKYGDSRICRKCEIEHVTKTKTLRKETEWSRYVDKHIGINNLLGSNKSLKSMGACSSKRPDKIWTGPDLCIIGECDEHQHKYSSGSYQCEDTRLSEIYDQKGIIGGKMVVIRWNPDTYQPPNKKYKRMIRKDRLDLFVKFRRYIAANVPSDVITVFYMFYSKDNPQITRNYPYSLIYAETDFNNMVLPARNSTGMVKAVITTNPYKERARAKKKLRNLRAATYLPTTMADKFDTMVPQIIKKLRV
jgi:hypothetical protein